MDNLFTNSLQSLTPPSYNGSVEILREFTKADGAQDEILASDSEDDDDDNDDGATGAKMEKKKQPPGVEIPPPSSFNFGSSTSSEILSSLKAAGFAGSGGKGIGKGGLKKAVKRNALPPSSSRINTAFGGFNFFGGKTPKMAGGELLTSSSSSSTDVKSAAGTIQLQATGPKLRKRRFIPQRTLHGHLPGALVDKYQYWQLDAKKFGRAIRGYPMEQSLSHVIFVEFTKEAPVNITKLSGTVARVLKRQVIAKKDLKLKDTERGEGKEKGRDATRGGVEEEEEEEFGGLSKTSRGPKHLPKYLTRSDPDVSMKRADTQVLLSFLAAPADSPLFSAAQLLSRIENLSHILPWISGDRLPDDMWECITEGKAWSPAQEDVAKVLIPDRIELPRLKIAFEFRTDEDNITRMYSLDHTNMFVPLSVSTQTCSLLTGIPHSLFLSNHTGELKVLVPNVMVVRPHIAAAPFSTELVIAREGNRQYASWYRDAKTPYFLYEIHVSNSFMVAPTLPSALYLLALRFMARDYHSVFTLANSIATDAKFSAEEKQIFELLGDIVGDAHPDSHACRLKISLAIADAPIITPWDDRSEYGKYLLKLTHISARCRLTKEEEENVSERCSMMFKKEAIVRSVIHRQFNISSIARLVRVVKGVLTADAQDKKV